MAAGDPERPEVLVIQRRSAYTALVSKRRNRRLARLVAEGHPAVRELIRSHEEHRESVHAVRAALGRLGVRARFLHRTDGLRIRDDQLVVVVGGDGTVLHVSHLVDDAPILAFNSAPHVSCGFLTVATADRAEAYLSAALEGRIPPTLLQRMRLEVDGRVLTDKVLNDVLFSNACPASTTRYRLRAGRIEEEHCSSGLWAATPAGSTAAIHAAGGKILPLESRLLQWAVREPYQFGPQRRRYRLARGFVRTGRALEIVNAWQPAVVYVDGPHYTVPVPPAAAVRLSLSPRPLRLLGYEAVLRRARAAPTREEER